MGLRSHLIDVHTAHAEHHASCAKAHDALHKALEDGPEKEFHKTMRDNHILSAEKCVGHARMASALDDAIPVGDGRGPKVLANSFGKAVETDVIGIAPQNPNLTLVSRFGSPTPDDLENVSMLFGDRRLFERGAGAGQ